MRKTWLILHLFLVTLLLLSPGGGGCFPLHYDSDEQVDGRRVTAIFYLNSGWQASHGGHLQLFPFPDPPVQVEPLADRLVLFSSCRMLHRQALLFSSVLSVLP